LSGQIVGHDSAVKRHVVGDRDPIWLSQIGGGFQDGVRPRRDPNDGGIGAFHKAYTQRGHVSKRTNRPPACVGAGINHVHHKIVNVRVATSVAYDTLHRGRDKPKKVARIRRIEYHAHIAATVVGYDRHGISDARGVA